MEVVYLIEQSHDLPTSTEDVVTPEGVSKKPTAATTITRIRRNTRVMIAHENRQILDFIVTGATHEQIMNSVGLSAAVANVSISALASRLSGSIRVSSREQV